jgi:hypothetical protein
VWAPIHFSFENSWHDILNKGNHADETIHLRSGIEADYVKGCREKRSEKLALQVDMRYRHPVEKPTGEIPV